MGDEVKPKRRVPPAIGRGMRLYHNLSFNTKLTIDRTCFLLNFFAGVVKP